MCNDWHTSIKGDNCTFIAKQYKCTTNDLIQWNPTLGIQCANFTIGANYCVANNPSNSTASGLTSTVYVPPTTGSSSYVGASTPYAAPVSSYNGYNQGPYNSYAGNPYNSYNPHGGDSSIPKATPKPPPNAQPQPAIPYQWIKPQPSRPACYACDGSPGITGNSAPGGVSQNGKCGATYLGPQWTTCSNSIFGYCCSTSGACGNTTEYCELEFCDPTAGYCNEYANNGVSGKKGGAKTGVRLWKLGLAGVVLGLVMERMFWLP